MSINGWSITATKPIAKESKFKNIVVPLIAAAAVLFTACGSDPQKASTNGSANANSAPYVTPTSQDAKPAPSTALDNVPGKAPVEFTYVGIAPDKERFAYRIKVNTDKPVIQADIAAKFYDDNGKMMGESTFAWQNVVKSARQPIEQGNTYEATGDLEPGSTKVEAKLKRVFFTDGSSWSAQ